MMTLHVVTALCFRGTVLLAPLPSLETPRINGHFLHSFHVFEQLFSFGSRPESQEDSRVRRRSTGMAKESHNA